jgi:predicted nucleic acid-binding protein
LAVYLADSSIWGWANKKTLPDITAKLAQRFARDEIATCAPVVLEAMHRANTGREYDELFDNLFAPIRWLELTDEIAGRAVDVQRELAGTSHGNHLRPAVDFLVAAIAEAAGDIVLWFFDRDLRVICRHTGQPFEVESATK